MLCRKGGENIKAKKDFPYSAKELEKRIDAYFSRCDEQNEKYTPAGLCLAIELPHKRMRELAGIQSATGEQQAGIQCSHLHLLQRALLHVQSQLEARTDTMATFLLRQPELGGYKDKAQAGDKDGEKNVIVRLEGITADAFD